MHDFSNVLLRLLAISLLVTTTACASRATSRQAVLQPGMIEGVLLDARSYLAVDARAEIHTYYIFESLASNLPAGILTDHGEFYYLTIESSVLADYAARRLRVQGVRHVERALLLPEAIWVDDAGRWSPVVIPRAGPDTVGVGTSHASATEASSP